MNINIKEGCIAEMNIRKIIAKSILRKMKKADSWFASGYSMNLYRGCTHNCAYCDGRSEGYYLQGEFGRDIDIKINAPEIFRKELDPAKKRKPMKRGFIMAGGGVGDSYQPLEREYELTRQIINIIDEFKYPVHILTKSTLVLRDIDILRKINLNKRAIVSFSFSSTDDAKAAVFEPGASPPSERLEAIKTLKRNGIPCGIYLLPVIPFVTDTPALLEQAVKKGREAGADFIVFGPMTLKEGRQKEYFLNLLNKQYPELMTDYDIIYGGDRWGSPDSGYCSSLNTLFLSIAKNYGMPVRIPSRLYRDMVDENDLVAMVLENIDYLLKQRGEKSPFGYAAYSISKVKEPLSTMRRDLHNIKGVGRVIEKTILEILDTGDSSYLKKLSS